MSSYSCCAEYAKSHGQSTSQPGPVLPSPRIHLSTKAAVLTPCFETLYLAVTVHCLSVRLDLRRKRKKCQIALRSHCAKDSLSLCPCGAHADMRSCARPFVPAGMWPSFMLLSVSQSDRGCGAPDGSNLKCTTLTEHIKKKEGKKKRSEN